MKQAYHIEGLLKMRCATERAWGNGWLKLCVGSIWEES
jgi:hypothetical protein